MRLRFILIAALSALAGLTTSPASAAETKLTVRDSEYGAMLWGPGKQAVYVFSDDDRNRSRCYRRCAAAWPPVLAAHRPQGGHGVSEELLGTIRRRNGDRQVTYAGRPLYYYAHEGSGDVECHDVRLNGGVWWVIGPDGVPRD